MSVLALIGVCLLGPAWAQGGAAGGALREGELGVALVVPPGVQSVRLTARMAESQEGPGAASFFTDDGSVGIDRPRDGEWWALLPQPRNETVVLVAGTLDGVPLYHSEKVRIPRGWNSATYPLTLVLSDDPETGGYVAERALMGSLPLQDQSRTGAGMSDIAQRVGLSPAELFAWFALFAALFGGVATIRGAVLRAPLRPPT